MHDWKMVRNLSSDPLPDDPPLVLDSWMLSLIDGLRTAKGLSSYAVTLRDQFGYTERYIRSMPGR